MKSNVEDISNTIISVATHTVEEISCTIISDATYTFRQGQTNIPPEKKRTHEG